MPTTKTPNFVNYYEYSKLADAAYVDLSASDTGIIRVRLKFSIKSYNYRSFLRMYFINFMKFLIWNSCTTSAASYQIRNFHRRLAAKRQRGATESRPWGRAPSARPRLRWA